MVMTVVLIEMIVFESLWAPKFHKTSRNSENKVKFLAGGILNRGEILMWY